MYYDEDRKTKKGKPFWLYVLVILLYFVLIGIVIAVLLLAPKYPSFNNEGKLHHDREILPIPDHLPEELPIAPDAPQPPYAFEKPFRPSALDPLYPGIDPRRSFDNSTSDSSDRELNNSRLLNLLYY